MSRSWIYPNVRILPVAIAAAGLWLWTFAPGVWGGAGSWIVRLASMLLWLWLTIILFQGSDNRRVLAAPLFLMVTLILWFYIVIPIIAVITISAVGQSSLGDLIVAPTYQGLISGLVDSEGEREILRFSLIGHVLVAWMLPAGADGRGDKPVSTLRLPRSIILGIGIFAAVTYIIQRHVGAKIFDHYWNDLDQQINFIVLVLYVTAFALAAIRWMSRAEGAVLDFVVLSIAAVGPMFFGGTKIVVFALAATGFAVALERRSVATAVGSVILALLILLSAITVRQARLNPNLEVFPYFREVLASKLVTRQIETIDCLTGVIRKLPTTHEGRSNPFYFFYGLVPRALWPDKPNLSQSGKIVIHYCHPDMAPNLNTDHSASGTLLWEPLAFAGVPGQIVAQALTFLILIVLSRIWINGSSYAAAGVLALTPWTIDFDQHFALYVANLAKAALVTCVFLFVLARVGRILRWR